MRTVLGDPKAMVPANKAVVSAGYRLLVPVHHVEAAYVRSHFSSVEIGVQDAPRPNGTAVRARAWAPDRGCTHGSVACGRIRSARTTDIASRRTVQGGSPRRSWRRSMNDESSSAWSRAPRGAQRRRLHP